MILFFTISSSPFQFSILYFLNIHCIIISGLCPITFVICIFWIFFHCLLSLISKFSLCPPLPLRPPLFPSLLHSLPPSTVGQDAEFSCAHLLSPPSLRSWSRQSQRACLRSGSSSSLLQQDSFSDFLFDSYHKGKSIAGLSPRSSQSISSGGLCACMEQGQKLCLYVHAVRTIPTRLHFPVSHSHPPAHY